MQHKVKATGQTGKHVQSTEEKILLEIPGETFSDQPSLKWFDKNELEEITPEEIAEKQPDTELLEEKATSTPVELVKQLCKSLKIFSKEEIETILDPLEDLFTPSTKKIGVKKV